MSNPTGSNVSEIKARTSGNVLCRIDVFDVGSDKTTIGVRLGDITLRVHSLDAINELHYAWTVAEDEMDGLPAYYEDLHVGGNPGLYRAHLVVDLPGVPARSTTRVRRTFHNPAHVRIQYGPLVWEVTDFTAWNDVQKTLTAAIDLFDTLDPR